MASSAVLPPAPTLPRVLTPLDNHEIISVNAKNLYTTNQKTRPDRNYQGSNKKVKNNKTTYQEQNSGGWGWFLFKTVIFFAVVAGGYAGWVAYRTQQSRRSRF